MPRKKPVPVEPEGSATQKRELPAKAVAEVAGPAEEPKVRSRRNGKARSVETAEPVPIEKAAPAPERRARAKRIDPQSKTEAPAPEPTPAKKGRPGRSSRAVRPRSAETDPVVSELPVPIWRPATARAEVPAEPVPPIVEKRGRRRRPEPAPTEATPTEQAQPAAEPSEKRGRRRRGGAERVETPAAPAPPAHRELIPIPEDAPQVVLVDGIPTLVRNKQVVPPFFFFGGSLDESRALMVLEQDRLAAEWGVQAFSHLVDLEVDPRAVDDAVAAAAYLLKKTVDIQPTAQVVFRVVFSAAKGWDKKFPRAKYVKEDGGIAEPSVCDEDFWTEAEACLVDFVRQMRKLPLKDHILGVQLERGEWFFAEGWGYDTSVAAHDKFREWVRMRYRDDLVAVRAAWFDGQAQFQTVGVPEFGGKPTTGEEFVRVGRKQRRWVDYHLFLSDVTVERIGKLAIAVKRASEGYFLVGVSYGYTFEWSHPASGHLSLGKLLRTPEIDFIAGPPSYKSREPGGTAAFPCPIDSFALNGKLYISEEDFKTPISGKEEPDDFNPIMRTPQALESVHWRGAGAALAHLSGVSWMDSWGNGWLNSPGIWQRAARVIDSLKWRRAAPPTEPDVAVFIDERSLAYLVDERAFTLLVQNVREAVMRSGLSVGFYLLSDLAHREAFPESKLYVFLNAWDVRPEVRSAIKTRLQCDGKVLFWLYAAGLFDGGRESLERVREITGIALKPQPFASKSGTTMLNRRHPLCEALPERLLQGGGQLEPSYFAIPEDGIVLGEYSQTGLPSFVLREFHTEGNPSLNWQSVFLGEPIVTPALFRALGQLAGAHVWNFQEDVVHVRPPFLTLHASGPGTRTLTLPNKWSAYNLLSGEFVAADSTHLRFQVTDGSTHTFLVGPKPELEAILQRDPDELLRVDHIPPRTENTIRLDMVHFDVPVMKLDEWIEESTGDDMGDDLLFRAPQLDLDAIEEEAQASQPASGPGRRRRRRRGRGGGSEESAHSRREGADAESFDDAGINIVFRKRD